ncbi:hypothetical protein ACQP2E_13785 [Actinoplanes sp. CA-015351]|uniref:hypothetical protein n=1 Tax=Actinoplanes sp. CA-015351 TaxID=3239897 RepID=UPI003D96B855
MTAVDWLLESDPSVRWQLLWGQDAAEERARVEHVGWGARLIGLAGPDGLWAGGTCFPAGFDFASLEAEAGQPWTPTVHTLQTLRIFGLDPASASARRLIGLIAENGRWEYDGSRYFDGEVEPCINGRTVEAGTYFGVDVAPLVARLVSEQLPDGGWNCEPSQRSSFDTTLCVLDGLLTAQSADAVAARQRGEEYLLSRGLFRRASTGNVVKPEYLDFAFPYYWHYDVLRALDYFRRAGGAPDPRIDEAVELVRTKRQPDGRWLLDRVHPGRVHFDIEDGVGRPSRWNTLRALRVLDWAGVA